MAVSSNAVSSLFDEFELSAVRFEAQQTYTIPSEQENLNKFLANEPQPEGYSAGWHDNIRTWTKSGKKVQRVKVVRKPYSDYIRYHLAWTLPANIAAGEDYRIITGEDVDALDVPMQDFWIFDERAVLLLNFNPDGTLRGRELADAADLGKYLRWRDLALAKAVPFGEYQP